MAPRQGLQGLLQQKHLSEMQIKVSAQAEIARLRLMKERVRATPCLPASGSTPASKRACTSYAANPKLPGGAL